jgi:alkylhydroperoxidase family enzyme
MIWLPRTAAGALDAAGAGDFARAFGLRPNLFEAWREFEALLWQDGRLDPVLLELCRRRLASLNGAALRPGTPGPHVDPEKLAELERWWKSERFTPVEKACLRVAEQFALDPKQISDADARPVTEALGDAGTVAFVEALAIYDGITRFAAMLELRPDGAPA